MPASPSGWEESSTQLARIIDPLGEAMAWFASEFGGRCDGYAVRRAGDHARVRHAWRDIIVGSMSMPSAVIREDDAGTPPSRWRFVERDPASCTMDWMPQGPQAEYWRMTASINDAQLSLAIRVESSGATPIQTDIRLRLVLASLPDVIRSRSSVLSQDVEMCRDYGMTVREQQAGIDLIVKSSPDTSTVLIEPVGNEFVCTITDHQAQDAPPVIRPDGFRYLSVQINAR